MSSVTSVSTSLITPPNIAETVPIITAMPGDRPTFNVFCKPRIVNSSIPTVSKRNIPFLNFVMCDLNA